MEGTNSRPHDSFRHRPRWGLLLAGGAALLAILEISSIAAASPTGAAAVASPITNPAPTLLLGIGDQPNTICALNKTTCSSGYSESRVQLSVSPKAPLQTWPAVQVAFVIETDAYDGVYDPVIDKLTPYGEDPCGVAVPDGPLCEESNGVPFWEDYMGQVVQQITSQNIHSSVSFAMLDYQGTCDFWDDGCYRHALLHVDVPTFQPAFSFSQNAQQAFKNQLLGGGYVYPYEDLADPFLHISSITAMYGAINGGVFNWTPGSHHVIVWMGSGAPRDPNYVENYCVSPSAWQPYSTFYGCDAPTCEPSFAFPSGYSPTCEGWVKSQDGNPADSIAGLAHQSTQCVQSVGGVCTIDTIDLLTTPTDPLSQGWPNYKTTGSGPGGTTVVEDTTHALLAGCDLAAATGGTWDGPVYFACPDGAQGNLQYIAHGPIYHPTTWNPTLFDAFKTIGFGPVYNPVVALGTDRPMFSFVPFGAIQMAWQPEFAASCTTLSGFSPDCQQAPTITKMGGTISYGWNWSTNASRNFLSVGDQWTVAFNVVNTGPPYTTVPVDACITSACGSAGSGAIGGAFTEAVYSVPNVTGVITQSFPLTTVLVVPSSAPGITPPPPTAPPIAAPGIPIPAPSSIPNPVLVIISLQTSIGAVSTQALAGGMMAAAFTRVMVKNRPVAMSMAMKSGAFTSKFDAAQKKGPDLGHME